jgi:hypothetical protein
MKAYQDLNDTFDKILRPAELPPGPMQPVDLGSPHLGPDFSPDAAIARFSAWQPWKPGGK